MEGSREQTLFDIPSTSEEAPMDFLTLARDRYSVRSFKKQAVEREKLNLVLQAGQLAPTACNFQPQRILVIESDEALNKLKRCTQYHFNAPVALLVCYNTTESWKRPYDGKDSGDYDACIVATHLMLQATELGLGTTWVGHFDPIKISTEFHLPTTFVPVAILPLGYPSDECKPNPMHNSRKPLEGTVAWNTF